jgi:hypothetical protein
MNSDPRTADRGPDDMGDDEQETDVEEYQRYVTDPPDDLIILEDDDNDAEQAADWAARHPRAAAAVGEPDDEPAEESAIHETPDPKPLSTGLSRYLQVCFEPRPQLPVREVLYSYY